MHVVTYGDSKKIKQCIKEKLKEFRNSHTTIEIEDKDEVCLEESCKIDDDNHIRREYKVKMKSKKN